MSTSTRVVCTALLLLVCVLFWSRDRVARPAAAAALAATADNVQLPGTGVIMAARVDEVWREYPQLEGVQLSDGRRFVRVALVRLTELSTGDVFALPADHAGRQPSAVVLRVHDEDGVRVIGGNIVGAGAGDDRFELRLASGPGELEGVLVIAGATYVLSSRHGLGWIRPRAG